VAYWGKIFVTPGDRAHLLKTSSFYNFGVYNRCKYLRAPTPRQGYEQVRVGCDFIYILLITIFENVTFLKFKNKTI
jgi:hypothetical protein